LEHFGSENSDSPPAITLETTEDAEQLRIQDQLPSTAAVEGETLASVGRIAPAIPHPKMWVDPEGAILERNTLDYATPRSRKQSDARMYIGASLGFLAGFIVALIFWAALAPSPADDPGAGERFLYCMGLALPIGTIIGCLFGLWWAFRVNRPHRNTACQEKPEKR